MAEKSVITDMNNKPAISPKPISLQQERKRPNPIPQLQQQLDLQNQQLEMQDRLVRRLVAEVEKKDDILAKMEVRLRKLEGEQIKFESLLFVKDNVSKLLSQRINQLEQYSRRYSVIVKGIPFERNERFGGLKENVKKLVEHSESDTTFDDVDKFHRNGPKIDGEQEVIIRFKSHSAKEDFYKKRKSVQEAAPGRVRIQPSLSSETKRLLNVANEEIRTLYFPTSMETYSSNS